LAVGLLPRHTLDVDDIFETVNRCDFSFAAFGGASVDNDFVVLANGD